MIEYEYGTKTLTIFLCKVANSWYTKRGTRSLLLYFKSWAGHLYIHTTPPLVVRYGLCECLVSSEPQKPRFFDLKRRPRRWRSQWRLWDMLRPSVPSWRRQTRNSTPKPTQTGRKSSSSERWASNGNHLWIAHIRMDSVVFILDVLAKWTLKMCTVEV